MTRYHPDGWEIEEPIDPSRLTDAELEELVPDDELDDETREELIDGDPTPAMLRAARLWILELRERWNEGPRARWGAD